MRGLRLLRAPAALLGFLCVLLLLGGTPAYAHTALKDATPGPGAKVAPGIDVVALTFGRLKSGTTPKISLTGPDGNTVPVGEPVVADDSVVCAAVTPLRAGINTLSYTVISADGDTQSSAFQFEVADGTRERCHPVRLPRTEPAGSELRRRERHDPGTRPHHGAGRLLSGRRRTSGRRCPCCAHDA